VATRLRLVGEPTFSLPRSNLMTAPVTPAIGLPELPPERPVQETNSRGVKAEGVSYRDHIDISCCLRLRLRGLMVSKDAPFDEPLLCTYKLRGVPV